MEQQIRFCQASDKVNIAYATIGQGPPLVKSANWLSHLEYDWQSPIWRHWLAGLAQYHTLVRYDERGTGLSDWDVTENSFDKWVEDLHAVVCAAGLDRFPLLGISQGGAVAIAYAARYPERVSQLILHGAYIHGRNKRKVSSDRQQELAVLNELVRVGWGKENPAFRQVFTSLFMPEATADQMHWFNDLQRLSASPENALRIRRVASEIDVTEQAATLTIPTLIFHPREDGIVPFSEGRLLAATIPNARFIPLESKNHIILENEPAWGQFLQEIRQFLGIREGQPMEAGKDTAQRDQARTSEPDSLTIREREVLELLAQGLRNPEIAKELYLSEKTIRNYISIIFSKLHVSSRGEAIVSAREAGFGKSEN